MRNLKAETLLVERTSEGYQKKFEKNIPIKSLPFNQKTSEFGLNLGFPCGERSATGVRFI